jgi:DNA modification methylase
MTATDLFTPPLTSRFGDVDPFIKSDYDVQGPINLDVPVLPADALFMPLVEHCAQVIVTSPPYLGQRVYGTSDHEVGREERVDHYLETMGWFADESRRVLRADGILWLNLGDKASGSGGAGGDYNKGGAKEGKPRFGRFHDPDYEVGQWLDIPGKVASVFQERGWRLRADIIWDKGVRERQDINHVNRPLVQHERIFMLQPGKGRAKFFPDRLPDGGGTIWRMPTAARERKGHLAPFPNELPRRCIAASTDPGDLVVDPFAGSGTTVRVARLMRRPSVGFDIYA